MPRQSRIKFISLLRNYIMKKAFNRLKILLKRTKNVYREETFKSRSMFINSRSLPLMKCSLTFMMNLRKLSKRVSITNGKMSRLRLLMKFYRIRTGKINHYLNKYIILIFLCIF